MASRVGKKLSPESSLVFRDDPHGVDDAGDVAKNGKQDVDPELLADAHLQKHTQGREKYGDYDTQQIHRNLPSVCLTSLPTTLPDPGGCKHQDARERFDLGGY